MPFNHNDHYHGQLLRQVPNGCRKALDVGCGTGEFARRLAAKGIDVDAVDASEEALETARARSADHTIDYRHADVTTIDLPGGHYDYISCLASIHHVPFETVAALREALSPNGVLAILGCYRESFPADLPVSLAAVPANAAARLAVAAWEKAGAGRTRLHGPMDAPATGPSMTLAEVRKEAARLLPGCSVRRRLFWRYLLVYRNSPI
ncbi:class I SAM-dependent methyltransferase [Nonomuraea sp. NPDC046802]|uniref:class I SAM-dependent methyltransferase n=1 Tax=Nonomuraea sp. NPDC046802 TaxID=3154919 RepID=UPI0034115C74